jgi:hypothetical protein
MIASFPFIASSMDSNARAFCQASGATDRAAINYFVKGIKNLGLWDDMVCWPLRSAQNAGTGSTAYSLGGLGTYNGTLVNGPTWGADGVNFADNTTQIITTNFAPLIYNNISVFSVMQCNPGGDAFNVVAALREDSGSFTRRATFAQRWTGDQFRTIPFAASGSWPEAFVSGFVDGTYHSALFKLQVTSSPKVASIAVDGSADTSTNDSSATLAGPDALFYMGNEGLTGVRALSGNLSFVACFNSVSLSNSLLHELLKSTLGQGLGLP